MFDLFSFEIRKRRDFGEVISDGFGFITRNIKGLLRNIVVIAGPFLLITSAYSAYFAVDGSSVFWSKFLFSTSTVFSRDVIFRALLNYFFMQLSISVLQTVYLDYTKLCLKKPDGNITPPEVWREVKRDLWKVVVLYIINLVILAATGGLLIVFVGAGMTVLIPFLVILYIFIYLRMIFAPTACVIENCSPFKAISYSWRYTWSRFWSNLGLLIVLYVLTVIIGYIFFFLQVIPFIIKQFFPLVAQASIIQVINFILTLFAVVGTRLISLFMYSGMAMQYFSIVEKEEGIGLMEKLDMIGKVKPRQFWNDETY